MLSLTAEEAARRRSRSLDLLDAVKRYPDSKERVAKLITLGADPNVLDFSHLSALHWAVKFNKPTIANELIRQGADVNHKDKEGRTPLSWAAGVDNVSSIQSLLDRGADINSQGRQNQTPLIWAVRCGSVKAVRMLLANGADKTIRDIDGCSPYNHACISVEMNKDTLGRDDSIKIKNMFAKISTMAKYRMEGLTNPLVAEMRAFQIHEPANISREINVGDLLKAGDVDVNGVDELHRSPLSYAAEYNQPEVADRLLEHGADVESKDVNGRTPLSWAASSFAPFLIRILIRNKADINSQDSEGQTPLSWAVQSGCEEAARILVTNDADRTIKDAKNVFPFDHVRNFSPFDYARMNAENEQEPPRTERFMRVMRLLDPSPKPRQDDIGNDCGEKYPDVFSEIKAMSAKSRGERLCQLSDSWVYRGRDTPIDELEEMKALLRAGTDVNFRDDHDNSQLFYAAHHDRCDIIRLLLNWYAEVDSKNEFGDTPLIAAARRDCADAADSLIQAGADINVQNNDEQTPLIIAVRSLADEVLGKLLANNADTTIRDAAAHSTYNYACRHAVGKISSFRATIIKSSLSWIS